MKQNISLTRNLSVSCNVSQPLIFIFGNSFLFGLIFFLKLVFIGILNKKMYGPLNYICMNIRYAKSTFVYIIILLKIKKIANEKIQFVLLS